MKTFYEAIGLEYLSQCVEIKSVTEMYSPCPSLQAYVTEAVCYIQRLLLVDYPEIYLQLQAKEIGRKLSAMTFAKVTPAKIDCGKTVKLSCVHIRLWGSVDIMRIFSSIGYRSADLSEYTR